MIYRSLFSSISSSRQRTIVINVLHWLDYDSSCHGIDYNKEYALGWSVVVKYRDCVFTGLRPAESGISWVWLGDTDKSAPPLGMAITIRIKNNCVSTNSHNSAENTKIAKTWHKLGHCKHTPPRPLLLFDNNGLLFCQTWRKYRGVKGNKDCTDTLHMWLTF